MKQVRIKNLNTGNADFAIMSQEDSQMLYDKFENDEDIVIDSYDISEDNLDTFEDVSEWSIFTDTQQWIYDE